MVIRHIGSPEAQESVLGMISALGDGRVDQIAILRQLRDVPEFLAPPQVWETVDVVTGKLGNLAEAIEGNAGLGAGVLNTLALLAMDELWAMFSADPDDAPDAADWYDDQYQAAVYRDEWLRLTDLAQRLSGTGDEPGRLTDPAPSTIERWARLMDTWRMTREQADRELAEVRELVSADPAVGVVWLVDIEELDVNARTAVAGGCLRVGATVAQVMGYEDLARTFAMMLGEAPSDVIRSTVEDSEIADWIETRLTALASAGEQFMRSGLAGDLHEVAVEALRVAGAHAGPGNDEPYGGWRSVRNFDIGTFVHEAQRDEWLRQRSMVWALRRGVAPEPYLDPHPSLVDAFTLRPEAISKPATTDTRLFRWRKKRGDRNRS